jgi:hypothetical protein
MNKVYEINEGMWYRYRCKNVCDMRLVERRWAKARGSGNCYHELHFVTLLPLREEIRGAGPKPNISFTPATFKQAERLEKQLRLEGWVDEERY